MDMKGRRLVMRRKVIIILGAAVLAIGALPARAQTFPSYSCADGTKFIVGFYPYDKRAHIQLDGRAVTLAKRLALSGARYTRGDVTLKVAKDGSATLKHARRPVTACSLI
jgi:membrane-bound inhibitor of C-type lysozyme